MPESWFELSSADQSEALEVAAGRSGRPAHLLEKDIWGVWALSAIYDSPLGDSLTFKGGTSLSKVYKVIDRFSEDIDLTYDIRELVPDLLRDGNPIPASASQEKKITSAVRSRLPQWIEQTVQPVIEQALVASGTASRVEPGRKRQRQTHHCLSSDQEGNRLRRSHDPVGVWCASHRRTPSATSRGLRHRPAH
jgi:hypothetical protein